ncbi:hypothetical protein ACFQWB_13410 [Paenibacillus thermoaerophilus]|uniref:Uncharacterized protein n=1 Tax=Paenibacillus thermoaerophilus TaxID=1215385 RepID=A0ABW2V482_9BACL|nr:hypothetical protein [Paenibacillus thermoaerophilus]
MLANGTQRNWLVPFGKKIVNPAVWFGKFTLLTNADTRPMPAIVTVAI